MEDHGTDKDNIRYEKDSFFMNLTEALLVIVECYMLIFLLYLAYDFAKNSTKTKIIDPLLEEEVPFAVYV